MHHSNNAPQIEQLNMDKEGLEKERDFYFNKLREIEVICQDNENQTHVKEIMDVLYATEVSSYLSSFTFLNMWNMHNIYNL